MHLPSRGAFQRSFTLLVHYRSRVVFSLDSRCLSRSREISNPRYSGSDPRQPAHGTGLSPCIALRSMKTSRVMAVDSGLSIHHIARRLRFGLRRVHSPLLTTSHSFSLPAPTKMFQSGAFPIAQGNCRGIPIRRSQVLRFRAAPLSFSQLGTSFIGARAELSTRWHSSHDGLPV